MNQDSRTACITGASSGIGAAFARRFAAEGYNLILHGRRQERLETLSNSLQERFGIRTQIVLAELSNSEELARLEQLLATSLTSTSLSTTPAMPRSSIFMRSLLMVKKLSSAFM